MQVAKRNACELDWSPDGTTLAVADRWQDNSELYLVDLANGGRRELITPVKESVTRPRFSPDGKWIAYSRQASLTSDDLYVVAAAGGQPRRVTRNPWSQKGFAWSKDGKRLVAISSRLSHKPQIFQFPLDGSEPYRVGELDVTRGTEPTLSRGKGSLAWVRDLSANSIWRMPVDQSRQPPESLTNSAAVDIDPEWSSNGRMVFRSDRSGVNELWIASADGSRPWQATRFRGPFVGDPHWSPDGRAIAFTSHADGNPDIYLMRCEQDAAACSEPRQLTRTPATDANPTWSADGRWIYFSSSRSGGYEVWRMPADGGAAPERITWNGGYMARESADGKWLYYSKLVYPTTGFWRIALPSPRPWAAGNGGRAEGAVQGCGHLGAGRAGAVLLPRCRRSGSPVSASASRRCGNRTDPGPSGGKHTTWEGALALAGRTMAVALADRPRSDARDDRRVSRGAAAADKLSTSLSG